MKTTRGLILTACCAFLLGVVGPAALIWNPAHWRWPQAFVNRLHTAAPAVAQQGAEEQLWTCSMHPQVLEDHPGDCPICGMKLVPVKTGSAVTVSEQVPPPGKQRKIKYWRAPMDPTYISDKPGKSPMGMDLIPVYEDEAPPETGVRVDPNFVQNFGVRTAKVELGAIPLDTRTVGILDYNQKNIAMVNTKFEGWIEKARVNYVGEEVHRGDTLFEIYSPQLVTTQQEYLAAVGYLEKLESGGADGDAVARARSLLKATGERLHYWDITDSQIEELARSGRITRTLKMVSPVSGIVVSKMSDALEGTKVVAGMNIYKIADLSTVWAQIEVFEDQMRYLRLGQIAHISMNAFPGRTWSGKIAYIDPTVNQQTRTLKAYVEIPNQDGKLRPDMYANVRIQIPAAAGVVRVPEEAVLHTGERNIVIVRKRSDLFEPREVQLGATGGGFQEVVSGLKPGETIVTSSQFLIDSESNLKEAISALLAAHEAASQASPAPKRAP